MYFLISFNILKIRFVYNNIQKESTMFKKFLLFAVSLFILTSTQSMAADSLEAGISKLQSGCDSKNMLDCYALGKAYSFGDGVKQDYKKAAELFSKACNGKVADACWHLNFAYDNGLGVEVDEKKALGYHKKACDLGRFLSCFDFAALSEVYGDEKTAKKYFKKACELGKKSDENDKELVKMACENI